MGDRVHDELGREVDSCVPGPGLPGPIEARTRQRLRRRQRTTTAAAALLVVVATVAVATHRQGPARTVAAVAGASTTAPALPSTATTVPITPAAVPPPSFLAAVGGGDEHAAVIDTASGHVSRRIDAAPSGQLLWALSPDGRTLYAASDQANGCGRSYVAIDVATGVSRGQVWTGISDLIAGAPSPDGQNLAYVTGCMPQPNVSDAFLGRPDGSVTALATGGPVIQMSWSRDGTMLALGVGDAVQVWAIGSTSVSGPAIIASPDPGCSLRLPRFAGTGLFAVEQCPGQVPSTAAPVTERLLLLNPATGVEQSSWTLAQAGHANIADLAVDPTGGWALYSYGDASINGQVSLLSLAAAGAKPRILLTDVFEVAWLPALPTTLVPPTGVPTTVPKPAMSVPSSPTTVTTPPSMKLPSCTSGAPTTPYFRDGCVRPDGSIQLQP
jgi:hypothetical protein